MIFTLAVIPSAFGGELKLERYNDIEYQFTFPRFIIFEATGTSIPYLMRFFSSSTYQVHFTRCSGKVVVNGKDSHNIICPADPTGQDWGVAAQDFSTFRFQAGDMVSWENLDIAGTIKQTNSAVDGFWIVAAETRFLQGNFPANPLITLTPNPSGVTFPIKQGISTRLPPNKGSLAVQLTYPSSIIANTDASGGVRTKLVELTGSAGSKVSLSSSINSQAGGRVNATILKANGSNCSQISVGESCDISFAAGSVLPGQSLKGSINITATMM